jgi:hypothetical protein
VIPSAPLLVLLAVHGMAAQAPPPDSAGDSAVAVFAEREAVRALRFTEGDRRSLRASKPDFTASAWAAFLKQFEGFLDPNGAPRFTSTFTPSGPPVLIGEKAGIVHIRIPGELIQSSRASRTTYRVAVDVEAGGTPRRIVRLTWTTCAGEAARRSCM